MVLRHWYVIRSSWPRTAELIYWPLVQMLTWGFLQTYLAQTTSLAGRAAGLFIGGVLLWDILVRGQLGFSVAFLEEIWSRNLGHLMMSPLRPAELVASLIVVSLVKLIRRHGAGGADGLLVLRLQRAEPRYRASPRFSPTWSS